MAKNKQTRLGIDKNDLMPSERNAMAEAELVLKKKNNHYRPIPKFRGGCKNC